MKIIYQDKYYKIINKDPGVLSTDISPLICHRLDRDTSGLLIIAQNKEAKARMQELFKERKIKKVYLALISGYFTVEKGRIEGYIVRHKKKGGKRRFIQAPEFAVKESHKRLAVSEYQVKKKYDIHLFKNSSQKDLNKLNLIRILLLTGRTHQIRVQFATLYHPVIGDSLYGGKLIKKINQYLGAKRQFLHAYKLEFIHPYTMRKISAKSPLPLDLKRILNKIKK